MRFALLLALPALCAAQSDGVWVYRVDGQNIFALTLGADGGTLTKSRELTIDPDGDVISIGPELTTLLVRRSGAIGLVIDGDEFTFRVTGKNRAALRLAGMRPWGLERVPDGATVQLATSLREPEYPENICELQARLGAMTEEDQAARNAFDAARIEAADTRNREEVLRMFAAHGWVTKPLAGKRAAHEFWLLVQHQTPEIQRRMLPALEKAAKAGRASMSDYAYLYDRVQVGRGRRQRWGTQAVCVAGKPALAPVERPEGLAARRARLYMLPVEEYLRTEYLVKVCAGAPGVR